MLHHPELLASYWEVLDNSAPTLDSAFGKFRTILYLSIVYAAGCVTLAFGAVSNTDQGIKNFPNMWVHTQLSIFFRFKYGEANSY